MTKILHLNYNLPGKVSQTMTLFYNYMILVCFRIQSLKILGALESVSLGVGRAQRAVRSERREGGRASGFKLANRGRMVSVTLSMSEG